MSDIIQSYQAYACEADKADAALLGQAAVPCLDLTRVICDVVECHLEAACRREEHCKRFGRNPDLDDNAKELLHRQKCAVADREGKLRPIMRKNERRICSVTVSSWVSQQP